jgi:hypothetical protein
MYHRDDIGLLLESLHQTVVYPDGANYCAPCASSIHDTLLRGNMFFCVQTTCMSRQPARHSFMHGVLNSQIVWHPRLLGGQQRTSHAVRARLPPPPTPPPCMQCAHASPLSTAHSPCPCDVLEPFQLTMVRGFVAVSAGGARARHVHFARKSCGDRILDREGTATSVVARRAMAPASGVCLVSVLSCVFPFFLNSTEPDALHLHAHCCMGSNVQERAWV